MNGGPMNTVIPIGGATPYDVVVGHRLADQLPALLAGASTVVVIADPSVAHHAAPITTALAAAGHRVETVPIEAGEQAKSLATIAGLWNALGELRLTRSDAIVWSSRCPSPNAAESPANHTTIGLHPLEGARSVTRSPFAMLVYRLENGANAVPVVGSFANGRP